LRGREGGRRGSGALLSQVRYRDGFVGPEPLDHLGRPCCEPEEPIGGEAREVCCCWSRRYASSLTSGSEKSRSWDMMVVLVCPDGELCRIEVGRPAAGCWPFGWVETLGGSEVFGEECGQALGLRFIPARRLARPEWQNLR
jgi:hypothetical protein